MSFQGHCNLTEIELRCNHITLQFFLSLFIATDLTIFLHLCKTKIESKKVIL